MLKNKGMLCRVCKCAFSISTPQLDNQRATGAFIVDFLVKPSAIVTGEVQVLDS